MGKIRKKFNYAPSPRTQLMLLFFVVVAVINLFYYRFAADMIIFSMFIGAIIWGESKRFVRDWAPVAILFLVYEQTRGFAVRAGLNWFGFKLWTTEIIWLERKIFFFLSDIPPVLIQQKLKPDITVFNWYDPVLLFAYVMFFWYWLSVGFWIWVRHKHLFKKYFYGLLGFSLFDNLIYLLFPTAPPWWSSSQGYLPELNRVLWEANLPAETLDYVVSLESNDFAAMPSHHTAWVFYASLFLIHIYGKKAWISMIIPAVIAFATWYGAEHYVVDSIIGSVIAYIAYRTAIDWDSISNKIRTRLQKE